MKVAALAALLPVALATGCARDVDLPDHLGGHEVGSMAERELEAENPGLAPGTLSCPDLDFRAGASVRCERTSELSGGRVVKVRGTVAVTSVSSGGRLHVAMDTEALEFGVAGAELEADVRRQYAARTHAEPSRITCPYLRAEVGESVVCRVEAGGGRHDVDVVVTAVDAEDYRTTYVTRPHRPES